MLLINHNLIPCKAFFSIAIAAILLTGFDTVAQERKKVKSLSEDDKATIKVSAVISSLRNYAQKKPMNSFGRIMTPAAFKMWNETVTSLKTGIRSGIVDFLNTSLIMVPTQKMDSGISALYSPFLDVILLLQTDNIDDIPRIENFCFLTGSDFRGEKVDWEIYPESILPLKQPLMFALLDLTAKTEKKFNDMMLKEQSFSKYLSASNKNFKYIERNMLARSQMSFALLQKENKTHFVRMALIQKMLQEGKLNAIKNSVNQSGKHFVDAYASLRKEIQKGMRLCHTVIGKDHILYAFSNKAFARFVVIVTVNKDDAKPQWQFEFFDINSARKVQSLISQK